MLGYLFRKAKRGRILSYWSAGQLIGAAFGVTVGGLVADAFGWRPAFFIVGIPGLIAAFLAWRMLEPTRGKFDDGENNEGEAVNYQDPASLEKELRGSLQKLRPIPTHYALLLAISFCLLISC